MVKLAKAAKKDAPPKKKAPPPPKEVEEESSEEDSDDDEEEEAPPVKAVAKKNAAPVKAVKNGKAAAKQESEDEDEDDEDDESEEEAPPPKKAAKAPAKAAAPAKKAAPAEESSEEDDDDDDDDESEEEAPPPKKAPAKATPAKATPAKKAAPVKKAAPAGESEDDDDDESEEEEAPPPKKAAAAAKPAAKAPAAKAPAAKEESDEEEDDDEEDDSEEEEMDTTPAPKAKKAGMVKAKEESEEEDDDDEEDDDEEEEETPATPAKRKAETKKEKGTPPAKKAKTDGEGFSLFLGNLNNNKDFDELKSAISKFFSKEGLEIQDVRLGGTKKFGYVDFASEEELQKALELNGKKLLGQPVKLDKARSKENSQENKKERDARTLFVKNLPYSITQDDLREIFDQAVDIRVPMGNTGTSRGIAYIEFKTEAIAEKALEEAQGSDVQGRSIIVDFTGDKSRQGGRGAPSASKVLVVNNLAFSASEDSLQSVFEKAVSIRIPQNNGRPKGYAFVEFENVEDSKEALENCNNTDIEGRSIRLEYSQNDRERGGGGRGNSGPTKTLFVKGLSDDTTDQTLKDSFDGAIAARIATDRDTGSSKGFGFVDFDNEQDCKAAKEAMDDGEIDGNKVTLDYAKPKGEGGRGGFGGGRGGFGGRGGGRGGFGGRGGGGRGGGFRGGRGGRGGGGGFRGGRGGGGRGGFGDRPQGKKIKFDD